MSMSGLDATLSELFGKLKEDTRALEEKFNLLRGVARCAIRVARQTQPLDDAGRCIYCENLIVGVGKGTQELKPHGEQCMWEIMRQLAEEYNEKYGGLHDKQAK